MRVPFSVEVRVLADAMELFGLPKRLRQYGFVH